MIVADDSAERDVQLPASAPPNTTSGWDLKATHVFYDAAADRLYLGLETFGIAGDCDGDGADGSTAGWLAGLGGVDHPYFGGLESVAVLLDTDLDGAVDFVAGVSAISGSYAVAPFVGSELAPGFGFGPTMPLHTGIMSAPPGPGSPHIAFTIDAFSELPGIGAGESLTFGIKSTMGSLADAGVGDDHAPSALAEITLCKYGCCDPEPLVPADADACGDLGLELKVGGTAWDIAPLSGDSRVDELYGYGTGAAASSNSGLEQSDTAVFALHRDPDGVLSLMLIIDEAGDGTAGRMNLSIGGLPAGAELIVEDDPGNGSDSYDMATGDFSWRWYACCTDGMAITDLPEDLCITLNASFFQGLDALTFLLGDSKATATFPATHETITICAKQPSADDDCDGVDDDCDGMTDEHFVVTPSVCGVGVCASQGQLLCVAGGELLDTCVVGDGLPTDTLCDCVDNDCDGATDEDYIAPWTVCGLGPCKNAGKLICDRGDLIDTCSPSPAPGADDDCDGVDDNCDGVPDNLYQPLPTTCGVGYCAATGIIVCSQGVPLSICRPALPGIEQCSNGVDDDCDGAADEDDTCDCGDVLAEGNGVVSAGVLKLPGMLDKDPAHTVVFDLGGGAELETYADGSGHLFGVVTVSSGGGGPTGPVADWYLDVYLLPATGGGYAIDPDYSSLQVLTPPWTVAYLAGVPGIPFQVSTDSQGELNFDGPVHFDYDGYRDHGAFSGSLTPSGAPGCDW